MLYQAPQLDENENAVIRAIDALHLRLSDRILVPERWSGESYRDIYLRTIGDQAAAAREPVPRSPGYRRAMTYLMRRCADPAFHYCEELIKALHFMLCEDFAAASPAQWRPREGGVKDANGRIVYLAPAAARIAELMDEFCHSLETEDSSPAIVRAAIALLNLVRIHPFRDANGRLARCLYTSVLTRAGYRGAAFTSIEEYIATYRLEYDASLSETSSGSFEPEHDTRPWVRFCLTAHYRQACALLRSYENFGRLCIELGADMAESGLEGGASIAASELFATQREEQVARWYRFSPGEIESRMDLNLGFHFVRGANFESQRRSDSAQDRNVVALLDSALQAHPESVSDPFALLGELDTGGLSHQPAA